MNFGWFEMDLPAVFISASCLPCMPFLRLRPSGGTGRVWFGPDGAGLVGIQLITWNHQKISKMTLDMFGSRFLERKKWVPKIGLQEENWVPKIMNRLVGSQCKQWLCIISFHPLFFSLGGVEEIRLNGRIPGATCIFRCRRIGSYGTRWWDILMHPKPLKKTRWNFHVCHVYLKNTTWSYQLKLY